MITLVTMNNEVVRKAVMEDLSDMQKFERLKNRAIYMFEMALETVDMNDCVDKFLLGEKEHGQDLLGIDADKEMRCEAIDFVNYLAIRERQ